MCYVKNIYPICYGMVVHKSFIVTCVASTNDTVIITYKSKRFSTFTNNLRSCTHWFAENNCKDIFMESVGKYSIPVYNILEPSRISFLPIINMQNLYVARKPIKKDAKWIADIFKHDFVSCNFIPPADIF